MCYLNVLREKAANHQRKTSKGLGKAWRTIDKVARKTGYLKPKYNEMRG